MNINISFHITEHYLLARCVCLCSTSLTNFYLLGAYPSADEIVRVCGSSPPEVITARNAAIYIQFVSDTEAGSTHTGFLMTYTVVSGSKYSQATNNIAPECNIKSYIFQLSK